NEFLIAHQTLQFPDPRRVLIAQFTRRNLRLKTLNNLSADDFYGLALHHPLLFEHVETRAGDVSAIERLDESVGVDQTASSRVDNDHAPFALRERLPT